MSPAARKWLLAFCGAAMFVSLPNCFGGVYSFSNTNAVAINDDLSPPTIATPYPSTITVTGFVGQVITDVRVTLRDLNHAFPSDVDVLLAGPQGQMAVLMSGVGGSQPFPVTNMTLVVDDDGSPMPIEDPLYVGIFKPTAKHSPLLFDFPPPVPPGNSNAVTSLSVFKNTDPTGIWKLFIVDDASGDSGELSGGWTLTLTIAVPLTVTPSPSKIVISWPASAPGLTLQTVPSMTSQSNWTNAVPGPSLFQGKWVVTNSTTGPRAFYRLVGP